jgi:hypothetical protein
MAESLLPRRCKVCRAEQVYRDSRWTTVKPARSNARHSHAWRPIGTSSTTRNRKLECHECDGGTIAYCSRAQIIRGLLVCPCGSPMMPASLEDACLALEHGHLSEEDVDRHPENEMFARYEERASHAQQGAARRGRIRNESHVIAAGYVAAERYEDNARRRLAAIAPSPEPMCF